MRKRPRRSRAALAFAKAPSVPSRSRSRTRHAAPRRPGPEIERRRDPDGGERARRRAARRRRAEVRHPAPAAAWHPVCRQGSPRHEGRGDDVGLAPLQGPCSDGRRDRDRPPRRGRRHPRRQARDGRAGRGRGVPVRVRLGAGAREKPLEPETLDGRLLQRLGCRRGGRPRALRARLGDVGLDRVPVQLLRHLGPEAHVRARQPAWRDAPLLHARQDRPSRALGRGPRNRARRDRRRGPGRSLDSARQLDEISRAREAQDRCPSGQDLGRISEGSCDARRGRPENARGKGPPARSRHTARTFPSTRFSARSSHRRRQRPSSPSSPADAISTSSIRCRRSASCLERRSPRPTT